MKDLNKMNCFDTKEDLGMLDCHLLAENFNDYLSDYIVVLLIDGKMQREFVTIDYELDDFKNILKLEEALVNSLGVKQAQCINFKLLKKYSTTDNLELDTLEDLDNEELRNIRNNY